MPARKSPTKKSVTEESPGSSTQGGVPSTPALSATPLQPLVLSGGMTGCEQSNTGGASPSKRPRGRPPKVRPPETPATPLHASSTSSSQGPSPRRGISPGGTDYKEAVQADLMNNRRVYRAPFRIHLLAWNPRMDVLALASEKGEVALKRVQWKTAWKLNVNNDYCFVESFPHKPREDAGKPTSLAWSPDGLMLAVGMSNGLYHLIDAEIGVIRFTWKLPGKITKLRWQMLGNPDAVQKEREWDGPRRLQTEDNYALACRHQSACPADAQEEKIGAVVNQVLELSGTHLPRTMHGTVITAILEDLSVVVLLGGVLSIAHVLLDEVMSEAHEVMMMAVTDAYVVFNGLEEASTQPGARELVVVYAGAMGSVPTRRGDYWGKAEVEEGDAEPEACEKQRKNQMIGLRLPILALVDDRMWLLVDRFLRMYTQMLHLVLTYPLIERTCINEGQKLVNRFSNCGFPIGAALITQITSGITSPALEEWVLKMGAEGAAHLRDYHEKNIVELVFFIRSGLLMPAQAMMHQMAAFSAAVRVLQRESTDPFHLLLGDIPELPSEERGDDEYIQPNEEIFQDLSRAPFMRLIASINQMCCIAELNSEEIAQLSKWISLLPPILRQSKRLEQPANLVRKCRGYEFETLLRVVINNFIDVPSRPVYEKLLFHMDDDSDDDNEEERIDDPHPSHQPSPPPVTDKTAESRKIRPLERPNEDRFHYRADLVTTRRGLEKAGDGLKNIVFTDLPMYSAANARPPLLIHDDNPEKPEDGVRRRGNDDFEDLDKISMFFDDVPIPDCARRMMKRSPAEDWVDPFDLPLESLPSGMRAVVAAVNGVHVCLQDAVKDAVKVNWALDLSDGEEHFTLDGGDLRERSCGAWLDAAPGMRRDPRRKEFDEFVMLYRPILNLSIWSEKALYIRTLFPSGWKRNITGINMPQDSPFSFYFQSSLTIARDETRVLEVTTRRAPEGCGSVARGAASSPVASSEKPSSLSSNITPTSHPLIIDTRGMDEDEHRDNPGRPLSIQSAVSFSGGYYAASVKFQSSKGIRYRLVCGHTAADTSRFFIHEDPLRLETYDRFEICPSRLNGVAVDDNGTRVTWFELGIMDVYKADWRTEGTIDT